MFKFLGLTLMLFTVIAIIAAVCLKLLTPVVTTRKSTISKTNSAAYVLLALAAFCFTLGIVFLII